jgi:hypothetical protein
MAPGTHGVVHKVPSSSTSFYNYLAIAGTDYVCMGFRCVIIYYDIVQSVCLVADR